MHFSFLKLNILLNSFNLNCSSPGSLLSLESFLYSKDLLPFDSPAGQLTLPSIPQGSHSTLPAIPPCQHLTMPSILPGPDYQPA